MAERFKRLYKPASEFVCTDAPITVEDGALLQDTVTGKLLVQLKLKNISGKNIKAVKVGLKTFDIEGLELAGIESFSYLDLNIMPNNSFGSKNPIMINDVTTRSYKPYVTTVVFNDDTVWNSSADKWFRYRERKELKEELDINLRQEYISELSSGYNGNVFMYVPVEEKGYYRCACGILNKIDNEKCASCKTEKTKIFEKYNIEQLTEAFNKKEAARKAKEETERIEREKREEEQRIEAQRKAEERRIAKDKAAKKLKKAFAIGTPIVAACIAFVIILTTVILPTANRNKAYDIYGDILNNANVGDTITFGKYEQDNNTSNGKEKIEWIVLSKENNKALLISKYALDCQQYNTSHTDVSWKNCSLRKWLNGTFMSNAFDGPEKTIIAKETVSAEKNPRYHTNPGNATTDKVFLLNITEAEKYFSSDSVRLRQCSATAYAKAQGAYTNTSDRKCWWWLRSPGSTQRNAAYVNHDGSPYYVGARVDGDALAVRPALWISLG